MVKNSTKTNVEIMLAGSFGVKSKNVKIEINKK